MERCSSREYRHSGRKISSRPAAERSASPQPEANKQTRSVSMSWSLSDYKETYCVAVIETAALIAFSIVVVVVVVVVVEVVVVVVVVVF